MKRHSSSSSLVSFLSGDSWAFTVVGVWVTFQSFLFLGWLNALLFTFLFVFLAFFVIAFLDHLILAREHYEETLRQTTLLEEIRDGMQVFNRDNTPVETELLTLNPSS